MEILLLQNLETLIFNYSDPKSGCRLQTLTLARSLLTNPSSSPATLHSVLKTLIETLNSSRNDPTLARHVIKVLGDASALHSCLVPQVIAVVRSVLDDHDPRTAASALSILDSLVEDLALDEELVLSLASSPAVSVRSRVVDFLADRSPPDRPETAVRVMSVLSRDIYPSVRWVTVDGMARFLRRDGFSGRRSVAACWYICAVELLRDEDEFVRLAAIRLVRECGELFASTEAEADGSELMNMIFVQLCSMARDMSLKVRIEAFTALGRVRLVSESVLLQSLSKKMLGSSWGEKLVAKCSTKGSRFSLACAAGAFVHGIEDEFHEVRTAACRSMGMLSMYSIQFSRGALNLLMDMLHGDAASIRLQPLHALFQIAMYDRLVVQEEHMHMFLGLLADISPLIRHAARKVLRLMKLPEHEIFVSAVDGLIKNLMTHPEEEKDIFSVLFFIGKNHGKFAVKRLKGFEQEIVPPSKGELRLDCQQAAALLVLAVSASFSDQLRMHDIPATLFAYAVPLCGRISRSLGDIIDSELLLAYIFHHSGMLFPVKAIKSKDVEMLPYMVEEVLSDYTKYTDLSIPSWSVCAEISEVSLEEDLLGQGKSTVIEQSKQRRECLAEEVTRSVKLILKSVKPMWPLMQSQRMREVRRRLRACKEELEVISWSAADGHASAILAFTSYYIQVMQLFAELLEHLQPRKLHVGMIPVDLLMEKLEICLKRMRYCFLGLSKEEESHILELNLLVYVLGMYKVGIYSDLRMKKLHAIVSGLERSSELSNFAKELEVSCMEGRAREATQLFPLHKLMQLVCLEVILFSRRLRFINAELCSVGNSSENPLPFISGLPVGITFQIKLYNVSGKDMLWLRMAVGKSVQYGFLDLCMCEGSDELRKCTVNLPFYATPKVASFRLNACIFIECPHEDSMIKKKVLGGPSHDIIQLCEEHDVYLVQIEGK